MVKTTPKKDWLDILKERVTPLFQKRSIVRTLVVIFLISLLISLFKVAVQIIFFKTHIETIPLLNFLSKFYSLLIISFIFSLIGVYYFSGWIKNKNKDLNKGIIWFLEKNRLVDPPFFIRSQIFAYNLILVVLTLISTFLVFYLIMASIVLFVLIFLGGVTDFLSILITISFFLSFLSFSIFLLDGGVITKKRILLFLFRNLNDIKDSKEQRTYLIKIFDYLKHYSFISQSRNERFYSKILIKNIVLYYENIVIPCLGYDFTLSRLFPQFKKILLEDNYPLLFEHLSFLQASCKKKSKNFNSHINLIESLLKKGSISENLIFFSNELDKIKIKHVGLKTIYWIDSFMRKVYHSPLFWVLTVLITAIVFHIFGFPIDRALELFTKIRTFNV